MNKRIKKKLNQRLGFKSWRGYILSLSRNRQAILLRKHLILTTTIDWTGSKIEQMEPNLIKIYELVPLNQDDKLRCMCTHHDIDGRNVVLRSLDDSVCCICNQSWSYRATDKLKFDSKDFEIDIKDLLKVLTNIYAFIQDIGLDVRRCGRIPTEHKCYDCIYTAKKNIYQLITNIEKVMKLKKYTGRIVMSGALSDNLAIADGYMFMLYSLLKDIDPDYQSELMLSVIKKLESMHTVVPRLRGSYRSLFFGPQIINVRYIVQHNAHMYVQNNIHVHREDMLPNPGITLDDIRKYLEGLAYSSVLTFKNIDDNGVIRPKS